MDLSKLKQRKASLYQERLSFDARARECSQFILPRAGRFYLTDRNKGDNRYLKVFDNAAIRANRILSAGLMAGMTSPARPWFRLATPDPGMMEYEPVRLYLDTVTKVMRIVFAKSNLYKTLHSLYEELGCFGTAAAFIERDFNNIVHSTPLTFGEFAIAQNGKSIVDTMVREFEWTVGQIVKQFGLDNVSENVKNAYNNNKLETWIPLTHVVAPREEIDLKKKDNKNMPWMSVYFESASTKDVLSEKGFPAFPFVAPRWGTSGSDVYGSGPGAEALGMVKGLQSQTLRKAQAIDYQSNPALQMPAGYKSQRINTLPGGTSFVDMSTNGKIQTAFDVRIDLQHLGMDIQDVRNQIESTFYVDLFMMLANDNRSNITAREIEERHSEKLLMLGPVLERLHFELIEPLIDIVFDAVVEARVNGNPILPPPPPELEGIELKVDFISTLAQAQKQIGLQSIEGFAGFAMNMAQAYPEVLDKFNADQAMDLYADLSGADPTVVNSDDAVAKVRAARAQKQQQQEQMAQAAAMAKPMSEMAGAAKTMSETPVGSDDDNALSKLMSSLQGY